MATLSLAMIVKNEASRLARCLETVRGLVDEVIIVDTGSSDETVSLARARGALVHSFPWIDDFSAARNESLSHCTGDWILILDGDETLDERDHPTIRKAMTQDRTPAYRLILRNYFRHGAETIQGEAPRANDSPYQEGSEFPYYADGRSVRLCRRLPGLGFTGRVHELLEPFFQAQGLPVEDLDVVIHHFGKADRLRETEKKSYYLELALREAARSPGEGQLQFNVLQQAMAAENWEVVLEAALAYLRISGPDVHPLVPLGAGMALQFLGRHPDALPYLENLLKHHPRHTQGLTRRAVSLAALGRLAEARSDLRKAIQIQPGFIVPYVNLAELESQTGDPGAARKALQLGLDTNPGDPQLLHALVQLDLAQGDLEKAAGDAWTAIQRCPTGGSGAWHRLVAFRHLQKGERALAIEVIDLGLTAFPDQEDLLRLRSLAEGSP